MKKLTLNTILLAVLTLPANAEVLSPENALSRAVASTRAAAGDYSLSKTFNTSVGQPAVYLFRDNDGAIIVSADDNAQPLLAILDNESGISQTNPEFEYWMSEYARQIEWLRSNSTRTGGPAKDVASRPAIQPLLTTSWDQGAPYNDLAPKKNGEVCFTGCVATAITQVMNYHKWPEKATGSNTYLTGTNNFNLSCNFSDVFLDWGNMSESYHGNTTEAQNSAVANLMYAVGVALNMDYGVGSQGGSGAYTENVPYALVKYFNYDKGAHVVYRDAMRYADWEQLVYDQLSLGPVYYAGSSDDGAHAYVCDGYKDGYFHINWGWGGSLNGYYLLTAMFPGSQQGAGGSTGSYDFDQMIVADIKKPQTDSKVESLMIYGWGNWLEQDNQSVATMTVDRNSQITITGWAQNRSIESVSLTAGLQLESEDGVVTVLEAGNYDLKRYDPYLNNQDCYIYYLTTIVPDFVKNGKYVARPVYKINGESEWKLIKVLRAYHQAYLLEVTDDYVTLSQTEYADVLVDQMEFSGRTVAGKSLRINGSISNRSDYDYESCIRMYVFDINDKDKQVSSGGRRFITVPAGETIDFTYESILIDPLNPGRYMVWIADAFTGQWIGNGILLDLEKTPEAPVLQAQSFTFNGNTGDADNMNLGFTLVVKCAKGWFRDRFEVTIWTYPDNGGSGYQVASVMSDELELNEGQNARIDFHSSIPEPEPGMRYIAGAWYGGKQYGDGVIFRILKSGVDEMNAYADQPVEYYNLQGVKVSNPTSGIYIVRQGEKAYKIMLK